MAQTYRPDRWYWLIAETTIYSSAKGSVVEASDAAYVAFLARGNAPTPIPSFAALDDVLTAAGLPVTRQTPPTRADLVAYAAAKADAILATAKAYGTSPTVLLADRTASTLADLLAIRLDAESAPDDPVRWLANDGGVTTFTAAQIAALAPAIAADRKAIYGAEAAAVAAINAGTITTRAAIDALDWPA